MKTSKFNLSRAVMTGTLVLALTAVFTLPLRSSADTVKGAQAQLLNSGTAIVPVSGSASAVMVMTCPQCSDKTVISKTMAGRGAFEKVSKVNQHLCPTCRNSIKVTGHGKAAVARSVHECTTNNAAGCATK